MRVRFGYVAMSLDLKNASPSKTITVKWFKNLAEQDYNLALTRVKDLTRTNLTNTLRILKYNVAYQVHLYRFTSKLIPLATHPLIQHWDYVAEFADQLKELGDFIKKHHLRVSFHPDHYTLINSPNTRVVTESLDDLWYHHKLLVAMGLNNSAKLVMHVGGMYGDKITSLQRFQSNFRQLPQPIAERLILENDDKSYTATDVLKLCQELNLPMVLDVHHHHCCAKGENLNQLLKPIFATWEGQLPKVHLSSPKNEKNFRSHADYIDVTEAIHFLTLAKETVNQDFDVMIEAKKKDQALFDLMHQLKTWSKAKFIDDTTIEL